ncbi:MAG: hypothetical protein IJT49_07260 [Clostridia bacterium]|nr:hypothetical protein [Clostridia bacterium]
MTDKEKYAKKLMDTVGEIDDKYVYEAQNYTPKKRMPGYIKAIIAAAASVFLIVSVSFPVMVGVLLRKGNYSSNDVNVTPAYQMEQSMSKSDAETYKTLPKMTGAALIWRTAGGGYSCVPISEAKAESIIESIGEGGEKPVQDDGTRIWIRTDNGEFVSPHLKRSPGNVDCAVFEYSPETAISDEAARMIAKIINERN